MNNDDLFNRWNAWLEVIYDDVQGLLINRYIYQEVQEIVHSNPKIQKESAYYEWMGINYASTQAIGVRRQVDPRPDVISFANLLGEIKQKPEVLGQRNDAQMVDADLSEMKQKADKIRVYVNKRITQFDRSNFESVPTFTELNDCLDLLETLLQKYLKIFRVNVPLTLVPIWKYDWKKIFKTPWIEE